MGYWIVDGRKLTNEEYEELQRQEEQDKQRAREEASRLTKQLGEAYAALKEHLRQHPASRQITDDRALDQQIYQNLWQNLERANQAPRCSWVREDGTGCGSPKMKNHIYCYAHCQMMEARAKKLALPPPEDANAIQMAISLVQRALIDDEISEKKAGLLLYSLQIAAANVDKTTFGQASDEEMVTETEDEKAGIAQHEQALERQKRVEEVRRGKSLPLINTDDTDQKRGERGLPRMNADERGSEGQGLPLINTENTDQNGGGGRMLPPPASGGGGEARSRETYANLG